MKTKKEVVLMMSGQQDESDESASYSHKFYEPRLPEYSPEKVPVVLGRK
jgi:hypothetical protein